MFCDKISAITMSKNLIFQARLKYINLKYHLLEILLKDVKLN